MGSRFIPGKNFDAIVYREAAGIGESKRGTRGKATGVALSSKQVDTNLVEIAEDIVDDARAIAAGEPRIPRNAGGLRSARGNTPRSSYAFRRERAGRRRYYNSFTDPVVTASSRRIVVTVLNTSPAADLVEEGTGPSRRNVVVRSRGRGARLFKIPLKQSAYRKMNRSMSLSERRAKNLISGDKDYRRDAERQRRLMNSEKALRKLKAGSRTRILGSSPAEYGFGQVRKNDKRAARLKLKAREANKLRGRRRPYAMRNQAKGYARTFSYVNASGTKVGRSKAYPIKRDRFIINRGGKAYLYTNRFSRYTGYDIFARALREAVSRIQ